MALQTPDCFPLVTAALKRGGGRDKALPCLLIYDHNTVLK